MALALVTGAYDLRHRTRFMPNHNERSVQREICEEIWGEKQNAHSGILYAIELNGGVDGTRTRGLCRDRAAF